MKVAVIDFYDQESPDFRDPITIPSGLSAAGINVTLVTRCNFDGTTLHGIPIMQLNDWMTRWINHSPPDCVIAISRFDPTLNAVLREIKKKNIPLIIKGDTDGTLGFPIPPNYLRARPALRSALNILSHLKWRFPTYFIVGKRLEHIRLADAVVLESPGAGVNICQLLQYWSLDNQLEKLEYIPNSISRKFTEKLVKKNNQLSVLSVGRWDDIWCKGSDILSGVITAALEKNSDIRFTVVGNNSKLISDRIPAEVRERVTFEGEITNDEVQSRLAETCIFLVPSRLESFSLSSAEALCSGASIVVTPIESLINLSGGGSFGSIARDFSVEALTAALIYELHMWQAEKRSASEIARLWRGRLNQETITKQWSDLVIKVVNRSKTAPNPK